MSELGLVNRCGVPDTGHDGTVDTDGSQICICAWQAWQAVGLGLIFAGSMTFPWQHLATLAQWSLGKKETDRNRGKGPDETLLNLNAVPSLRQYICYLKK